MTPAELAVRVLRKLKVLGASETADAGDLDAAIQGVKDAHQYFSTEGLSRWTLNDIPQAVETGYVNVGAFMCADEFLQPKQPEWFSLGLKAVQAYVNIPYEPCGCAVDF